MILSMTGFAAATAELPGVSLSVELRSVNHRYLDLTLKLPDELARQRIRCSGRRWRAPCAAARWNAASTLNRTQQGTTNLAVDSRRVGELAAKAAAAGDAARLPQARALSVNEILRWPGVLTEPSVPPEELAARTGQLVEQALAELAAARASAKAQKTAAILEACCAGIETQVARVAPRESPWSTRPIPRSCRRGCEEAGPRSERGSAEAGTGAVRHQGRRRRGARRASPLTWPRCGACCAPAAAPASVSISWPRSCTARRTRWARSRSMPRCPRRRSSSRCSSSRCANRSRISK